MTSQVHACPKITAVRFVSRGESDDTSFSAATLTPGTGEAWPLKGGRLDPDTRKPRSLRKNCGLSSGPRWLMLLTSHASVHISAGSWELNLQDPVSVPAQFRRGPNQSPTQSPTVVRGAALDVRARAAVSVEDVLIGESS